MKTIKDLLVKYMSEIPGESFENLVIDNAKQLNYTEDFYQYDRDINEGHLAAYSEKFVYWVQDVSAGCFIRHIPRNPTTEAVNVEAKESELTLTMNNASNQDDLT